ncbi:uncharacterized protein LOC129871037 [Solanum dulcamara]|uniref:uncharacterized protein LOC129871037 n=1 Tax=Solanum dulcamara TaxID=45834 RepID=UPI002485F3D3|nr:uncharacterized protein LOC129871037 [Solanum dulcamara]
MDDIKDQVTPASEAPVQGRTDSNEGQIPNDPLAEQVTNAEFLSRPNKEKRPFPLCDSCGRTHQGEYVAGKEGCYKCGGMGHKMRDCQVASSKGRESKRARCKGGACQSKPSNSFSTSTICKCSKCGKNHRGECLLGSGACYKCGKPGHYTREGRSSTRPQALAQTIGHQDQSATTSDGGQHQERLYAFQIHQELEDSPNIGTGATISHWLKL